MQNYRNALPQLSGDVFLTDAGVETDLIFNHGIEIREFAAFTLLACVILLCYGGGFGTMPAFTADYFGAENVGSIYGLMLTAWSVAGVLGPTLIAALRQSSGGYDGALRVLAGLMLISTVIPAILRRTP